MNIQNRENEAGLIGALMRDPYKYESLRDLISPVDFSWSCYGWAWEAFGRLHQEGLTIDVITVGDELERMGCLGGFVLDDSRTLSGRAALGKLRAEGSPLAVEAYASNILDYSGKRQLEQLFAKGTYWASNGRRASDIVSDVTKSMGDIRTYDTKSTRHTQRLGESVSNAYDHTADAANGKIQSIPTGFIDLDRILGGGMSAPDLLVIAGRPGQGKTGFLVSVAKNVAEKQKKKVAFFSLEMNNDQIAMRLLSQESGVPYDKQKSGALEEDEWPKYTYAVEKLSDFERFPIYLNDLPSIKPSQIRRELMRLGDVDLVIVDYIGLADPDGKYDTRALEVTSIMKSLKAICKEFGIPVLASAQLSRAVELRNNKRPILSDLKESGGIEENADVVMFIYHPEKEDRSNENITELIVAKHRNGQVGVVELLYLPHLTRFESVYIRTKL